MPVQTSVAVTVNAPLTRVFDIAISIEPSELVQSFGPLPGVRKTHGHQGPWTAPGDLRRHTLTDNSSVDETLTAFTRDSTFAYRLSNFTGVFSALVAGGRAEWHFTRLGEAKTQIDWTYAFDPKGPAAEALVWFIVKLLWPGYLRAALERVKDKAEIKIPHENRDL